MSDAPVDAATPVTEAAPSQDNGLTVSNMLGEAKAEPTTDTTIATEAEQPGEAKAADEKEAEKAEGAPEEYTDFTMPEGLELKAEVLTDYKALAKDLNLTQDAAQKLVEFGTTSLKEAAEAPYKLWADTQKSWQDAVKSDADIGGAKLQESLALSAKAIDASVGDALREGLNVTGAGNHPAMVKHFTEVGRVVEAATAANLISKGQGLKDLVKVLSNPEFTSGKPVTAASRDAAHTLYPDHA
ncbi:hypothetical protein CU669_15115 [Paramagnetospirillum kuznetsovii]|uniref:Peptidase n=1 Tax=Paramagnetospirillum kuznetsovii TaxID=2053833 RepID=A0A364NVH2_9PROT|nr:hypothetical protein [Paramagnetospirillum kuznetsovii]RAU21084.1 hypothetical protein CU669_15115 [Paramagnetospirillum kuznetsovii]